MLHNSHLMVQPCLVPHGHSLFNLPTPRCVSAVAGEVHRALLAGDDRFAGEGAFAFRARKRIEWDRPNICIIKKLGKADMYTILRADDLDICRLIIDMFRYVQMVQQTSMNH